MKPSWNKAKASYRYCFALSLLMATACTSSIYQGYEQLPQPLSIGTNILGSPFPDVWNIPIGDGVPFRQIDSFERLTSNSQYDFSTALKSKVISAVEGFFRGALHRYVIEDLADIKILVIQDWGFINARQNSTIIIAALAIGRLHIRSGVELDANFETSIKATDDRATFQYPDPSASLGGSFTAHGRQAIVQLGSKLVVAVKKARLGSPILKRVEFVIGPDGNGTAKSQSNYRIMMSSMDRGSSDWKMVLPGISEADIPKYTHCVRLEVTDTTAQRSGGFLTGSVPYCPQANCSAADAHNLEVRSSVACSYDPDPRYTNRTIARTALSKEENRGKEIVFLNLERTPGTPLRVTFHEREPRQGEFARLNIREGTFDIVESRWPIKPNTWWCVWPFCE